MEIKDRLRNLRRQLDLTQAEFAERIGSVQNTITGYENGRRQPSGAVISLICKEFNVNEEWLRDGVGEMFKAAPSTILDQMAEHYSLLLLLTMSKPIRPQFHPELRSSGRSISRRRLLPTAGCLKFRKKRRQGRLSRMVSEA